MSTSVSSTSIPKQVIDFARNQKFCSGVVTGVVAPTIASTALAATSGACSMATAATASLYSSGYLGLAIGCPTTLAAITGIGYLCRQMGKRPAFREHGHNIIHQLKSSPGITDATRIALDTIKPVAAGKIAIKMETQNRKRGETEVPSNIDVLRRINPRLATILEREIDEASASLVEAIPVPEDLAPAAARPTSSPTLPTSSSAGFYTYTMT